MPAKDPPLAQAKRLLRRFDRAAREYAFKGAMDGQSRVECIEEYHAAKQAMENLLTRLITHSNRDLEKTDAD